jgi:hypothetical protein
VPGVALNVPHLVNIVMIAGDSFMAEYWYINLVPFNNNSWIVGQKHWATRAEAEFAMLTLERALRNCGFKNIKVQLVRSVEH